MADAKGKVFDDIVEIPWGLKTEVWDGLVEAYRDGTMTPRELEEQAKRLAREGGVIDDGPDDWAVLFAVAWITWAVGLGIALGDGPGAVAALTMVAATILGVVGLVRQRR